jgi:hypothetical protein
MGNKVAAFVDNRNVHWLADFCRFLFGGCDNPACFIQCDRLHPLMHDGRYNFRPQADALIGF